MQLTREKIQILVLQSTSFCNIDCDYCYLPGRATKSKMLEEVLERVASQIIGSPYWADDSLLLWHAGEPLALGHEWYSHVHAILDPQKKSLKRIQFQSNGTLLNNDWIRFLKQSGSFMGLSIDGPQWLHDLHRKDRAGQGTFDRAMLAADLLRKNDLPFTNIATVTKDAINKPDEIFDFFYNLQPASLGFSVEEAEGANTISSLYQPEMLEQVEHFFQRIAERNFAATNPLRVREIESVLTGLALSTNTIQTSQETRLGSIISVSAIGDIALFSPELLTTKQVDGTYATVGNILDEDLEIIINGNAVKQQFEAIQAGVDECRQTCEFYNFCGGGSPANKYFETNRFDISESWYCRVGKQAMTQGILRAIATHGE